MQPRINNPAAVIPEAFPAIQAFQAVIAKGDLPAKTLSLVHHRTSQINGCAVCLYGGERLAKKAGESDERLATVAAWRDAPFFSDAERAALALAECVTRLSDRADPVPDDVWNEAARHYSETQLTALLLHIALTNVYNRLNVATRQVAGVWKP
jgi:AhpD family alkylhydroperoxidase